MVGNRLEWAAGFSPSSKASVDDLGIAVLLVHHVRDAHAGGLADTGAIKINFALRSHKFAQGNEFFFKPVGLNPY